MEFIVRKATRSDFDKVYPLFQQLWPGKVLNKVALGEVFCRGVQSAADELFCVDRSGEIIGFCAYAIVNNLWQEGLISYMYAMVIDESCRGNGIGTKLIKASLEDSKNKGLKRMELDSAFHREQAHQFYEKLGFDKRAYLFSFDLSQEF